MQAAWAWGGTLVEEPARLTPREAASGLLGSLSLTFWIFLLVCFADFPINVTETRSEHHRTLTRFCP